MSVAWAERSQGLPQRVEEWRRSIPRNNKPLRSTIGINQSDQRPQGKPVGLGAAQYPRFAGVGASRNCRQNSVRRVLGGEGNDWTGKRRYEWRGGWLHRPLCFAIYVGPPFSTHVFLHFGFPFWFPILVPPPACHCTEPTQGLQTCGMETTCRFLIRRSGLAWSQ